MTEDKASGQVHAAPVSAGTDLDEFDPFITHRKDPHRFFAEARRSRPVFYSPKLEAWCVTMHGDIERVLRDGELFSCRDHNPRPPSTLSSELLHALKTWRGSAPPMGSIDGAEHTRIRALAGRGFTARALNHYRTEVTDTAHTMCDQLASSLRFDFIADFAYPFPLTVVLKVLGVPREYHDRCRDWTELRIAVLLPREAPSEDVQRRCLVGLRKFAEMSCTVVAERLREPREDLISYMLHSEVRGHRMTPAEVLAKIPTLISAGHESTAQGLAALVRRLLATDGWRQVADGTLDVEALVEETLWYDVPIAGFFRTATRDCELSGVAIPRGTWLFLAYASGSRDEAVFSAPDAFDPARPNTRSHLAFGGGPHHCVGRRAGPSRTRRGDGGAGRALPPARSGPGTGRRLPGPVPAACDERLRGAAARGACRLSTGAAGDHRRVHPPTRGSSTGLTTASLSMSRSGSPMSASG
ncbi:cytochrome P450 [Streptomyces flaveolus]|uniref:cytochrome P450 n=1 Tax=Streptomyces flaveolus TaxID=67297 RepID=UPI003416B292